MPSAWCSCASSLGPAPRREAAVPAPGARPPDHEARPEQHEHERPTDTVEHAARATAQQVVVQVDGPFHRAHERRIRVAEIARRVLVEEPRALASVADQRDVDGCARPLRLDDAVDLVIGVGALDGRRQRRARERGAVGGLDEARHEPKARFAAKDGDAAADAEHDDPDAEREREPQVQLRADSPEPRTARALARASPRRVCARRRRLVRKADAAHAGTAFRGCRSSLVMSRTRAWSGRILPAIARLAARHAVTRAGSCNSNGAVDSEANPPLRDR